MLYFDQFTDFKWCFWLQMTYFILKIVCRIYYYKMCLFLITFMLLIYHLMKDLQNIIIFDYTNVKLALNNNAVKCFIIWPIWVSCFWTCPTQIVPDELRELLISSIWSCDSDILITAANFMNEWELINLIYTGFKSVIIF